MSNIVEFTDNYEDLSNEDGYQFEFHCERCGNGYRSEYKSDLKAKGRGLLRFASGVLDGVIGDVTNAAENAMNRNTNSKAKDDALREAAGHVKEHFIQCRACGDWVCRDICWNAEVGQCTNCHPFLDEEVARIRSATQRDQLAWRMQQKNTIKDVDMLEEKKLRCEHCDAQLEGEKFCPQCGEATSVERHCEGCGAGMKPTASFCGECGRRRE